MWTSCSRPREIDRLIRAEHIIPQDLKEEEFDQPLGIGSGAGVIFGTTGGVMEAALRSAYHMVTGKNPDPDAFYAVRGMQGWKEAKFDVAGTEISVAVAHGLGNTRRLMDAIVRGEVKYDFVEIMACPGGCAGGGGQPFTRGASWLRNAAARCASWTRKASFVSRTKIPPWSSATRTICKSPCLIARTNCCIPTTRHG